jgi:hypothetical protein
MARPAVPLRPLAERVHKGFPNHVFAQQINAAAVIAIKKSHGWR